MKLGTRARYGTRAILDLAVHYDEGPVVMRDVSRRQEVSESYLENLMIPLRAAGLVRTERGSRGGYTLNRPPDRITLGEIIQTLEGSLAPVFCVDDPQLCHRSERCVTRTIWGKVHEAIAGAVDNITLADMVKMYREANTNQEASQANGGDWSI